MKKREQNIINKTFATIYGNPWEGACKYFTRRRIGKRSKDKDGGDFKKVKLNYGEDFRVNDYCRT